MVGKKGAGTAASLSFTTCSQRQAPLLNLVADKKRRHSYLHVKFYQSAFWGPIRDIFAAQEVRERQNFDHSSAGRVHVLHLFGEDNYK